MSLRRRQGLFLPSALAARRDALFGEVLLSTPTAARRVLLFAGLAVLGLTALLLWGPYRARESVLHMLWEQATWLDRYVKAPDEVAEGR